MTDDMFTPAQVAQALQVSAPSVRRMAATYEAVFTPLPRDPQGHRRWPRIALTRLRAAHQAVSAGQVPSLEAALRLIEEGADLPVLAEAVTSDAQLPEALSDILSELQRLNGVIEAQANELAALRQEVVTLRQAVPQALPSSDTDALRDVLEDLQRTVIAQGERESERYRMLTHALLEVRHEAQSSPASPPRPSPFTLRWLLNFFR
ncbi:hypothetical protein ACFSR9_15370 [Deinococcus taklimakanensis]|uniref:MerR family transcriptional regulator n=1 Tax=Deinococcus taklimakanensis TaxID=536443 RepID=A0ABW5P9L1_9DEIO